MNLLFLYYYDVTEIYNIFILLKSLLPKHLFFYYKLLQNNYYNVLNLKY